MVCQCPRRALLISTEREPLELETKEKVSMPSAGSSHFYIKMGFGFGIGYMCQCPRRALLISTQVRSIEPHQELVSMPSAGSSHFYCQGVTKAKTMRRKGVNALGGLFSFLLCRIGWGIAGVFIGCQCPRRALLISTFGNVFMYLTIRNMCQCPRRALLISTPEPS